MKMTVKGQQRHYRASLKVVKYLICIRFFGVLLEDLSD